MKQRLIGAAVLVALAVIFLPMLLDAPAPKRGAEDVRLDLPSPPVRDFEARELPLAVPPVPATAEELTNSVEREPVTTVDTADSSNAPEADTAAAENGADSTNVPIATPSDSAPSPVEAAADPTVEETAAPAVTSVTAPPPAAADAVGRYTLRIGSFANLEGARNLAKRLRAAGLAVNEETIALDGKAAVRLQSGPYVGPAAANQAKLVAQRVDASLKPQVLEGDTPPPAVEGSGFAVQVGAFSTMEDANLLQERLRKGGFNAFITSADTGTGRLYRVRVGPEISRDRAESLAGQLKDRFRLTGMIVNHP